MASFRVQNTLQPGPAVPFKPIVSGKVSWYACGPTVYDHSHLGHARNYVSTDIIRRIMRDYFGYKVNFVMNITDVDDKIILKARRKRLLERELEKAHSPSEILKLANEAFQFYARSNLPRLTASGDLSVDNYAQKRDTAYANVLAGKAGVGDGKPGDDEAKIKMYLSAMDAAVLAIQQRQIYGGADEILLPYLDSLYKETIDAKDLSIFTDVTKYWEADFMEDMDALNVLRPDIITRVTAYVPQIVKFVDTIVQKGFAYISEGSVYFDIAAFEKAGNSYAHLKPESRNDAALLADGEGALSKGLGGKRGPGDFALWKRSKAGEPSWPSPWGEGRPGWHIECSVMASDILGSKIDIHSGGIDLAFPHHDNELAQSEAYYCSHGQPHSWVNYFLHMGHLSITGLKMSKSLKNYQTIKDALATHYTPRGMRIVFLMGRWSEGVEISSELRVQADGWESTVNNFFTTVKSLIAEADGDESISNLSLHESGLGDKLSSARNEMHLALQDSFDTPKAMKIIFEVIRDANIHVGKAASGLDVRGLRDCARWVTKMVGIFGLDANARPPYDGLGWTSSTSTCVLDPEQAVAPHANVFKSLKTEIATLRVQSDALIALMSQDVDAEFKKVASQGINDPEKLTMPYLRAVSKMRDELRREAPNSAAKKAILELSDRIRDQDLADLGVWLDDRPDNLPSLIKFVPRAKLITQRESKAAREREKTAQKEAARLLKERLEAERAEKAKISPFEMFRDERFSAWDEEGLPTKAKDGEEVVKSHMKKLRKDWERQKKLYEEYQK